MTIVPFVIPYHILGIILDYMQSCQAIVHTDGWEWTVVNYANFVYAYWDSRGVVASLSLHAILGLLLVSSVFSIGGSALLS